MLAFCHFMSDRSVQKVNSSVMKISIITVCFNSAKFLENTLLSVTKQAYRNWELIVIDGNSQDETISIIKSFEQHIAYWVSEPDAGMYDAINKGISRATGDYFMVLNSDDFFYSETSLLQVADVLMREKPMLAYGNLVKQIGSKQRKVNLFPVTYTELLLSTHGTFVPHPCTFISSALHEQLRSYSMVYRYASDFDYLLRATKLARGNMLHMKIFVTVFRVHAESITASGKINEDRGRILNEHGYYKHCFLKRKLSFIFLWGF